VIDAILLAAETSKLDGQIFHIVDRTRVTQDQVVRDYISKNAKNAKIIHLPLAVVYIMALGFEVLSKILNRPAPLSIYRVKSALARMHFDCIRAENELGWQPRVGVASGLQETMAAERVTYSHSGLGSVHQRLTAK
jgi:nucleoside-diphosphate-sugar epimerase